MMTPSTSAAIRPAAHSRTAILVTAPVDAGHAPHQEERESDEGNQRGKGQRGRHDLDPSQMLGMTATGGHSAAFIAGSKRASKSRMDFSTSVAICLSLSAWSTFRPNTSLT